MFKNIFIKKNDISCEGCTKCIDIGNKVTSIIILKDYSVLQGSHHTCIRKVPTSVIIHRLYIVLLTFIITSYLLYLIFY